MKGPPLPSPLLQRRRGRASTPILQVNKTTHDNRYRSIKPAIHRTISSSANQSRHPSALLHLDLSMRKRPCPSERRSGTTCPYTDGRLQKFHSPNKLRRLALCL